MSIGGLIRKGTSYQDPNHPDKNGTVYVHWDRNNFYKNAGRSNVKNIESLSESDVKAAYDRHRERVRSRMSDMENFNYEDYARVTTKTVDILDNLLDSSGSNNLAIQLQKLIEKRASAGLSSKWSFNKTTGDYSAQLKEFIKNIDDVQRVYGAMKELHEGYKEIDNEVVKTARKRGVNIAEDFPRNQMYMIKDVDQAKTSYDNLTKGLDRLETIINQAVSSGASGLDPKTEMGREAMEIYRKFTGMLNNIQGIGYEAIIEALLTEENMEREIIKELSSGLGIDSKNVKIVFEQNLGAGKTLTTLSRATTDVAFTLVINSENLSGSFDMNLSAKSIAKQTKNGLKKGTVSYKSGRPWSRVAQELDLVDTEFEYWFANLSVRNTTRSKAGGQTVTGKGAYAAIRNYIGAMYALDAIAGTGEGIEGQTRSGRDIVTHMIYLNKVMSVTDVLNELESKGGLNVTVGSSVNQGKEDYYYDNDKIRTNDKYIRSKNVLNAVGGIALKFSK